MKPEATKVSVEIAGGKQLSFETGKLAKQAARLGRRALRRKRCSRRRHCQSRARAPASIFSRSPLTTANTPMPADASPAALSSAKAA